MDILEINHSSRAVPDEAQCSLSDETDHLKKQKSPPTQKTASAGAVDLIGKNSNQFITDLNLLLRLTAAVGPRPTKPNAH